MIKPTKITLHKQSRQLEIFFEDGAHFSLSAEYLRVNSPSAENRGKKISGKENVAIVAIEPVGNYAIKIIFDDGHATGIYSWEKLYELGKNPPYPPLKKGGRGDL